MKERLWNVIGFNNKGLITASYCYARVVARWLMVLASYVGQPNLKLITFGMVLGTIEGLVVYLKTQIGDRLPSLDSKNIQTWRMIRDKKDNDVCNLGDDELSLKFNFD